MKSGGGERERRIRIAALADGELADVPVLGPANRAPVQELVLDEEDGPLVLDRRREQRSDVVALARGDDDDVRDPEQELLERLRVRRPVAAARAHRRSHDERHGHLVVVHLAELRDPVDDLVEPERDEVAEHDLEDRPLTSQRHPGGDAEQRRLADRRREDTVRVRVAEPRRHLEGSAVRIEHVLTEEDDVVALREDRVQRLVQHLDAALP